MSVISNTSDRLRRATALWHAYLTITGQRFDLASFLNDPELEKKTLASALASGDQKLVALAQDWLRDTGQTVPAAAGSRVVQSASVPAPAIVPGESAAKPRYLRGVR
jgi:hypothetical protein